MGAYLLRKAYLLIFVTFGVTAFAFSLNYLFPGDPLSNMTGLQNLPPELTAELNKIYKLDSNIIVQYWAYMSRILEGNWGVSFINEMGVYSQVFNVLPATIELAAYALLYSFIVAIPLGILASDVRKPWLDKPILAISLIGFSMPIFWFALILILIFSINLGWLPISGRLSLIYQVPNVTGFILIDIALADIPYKAEAYYDAFKHLAMPTLVLAAYPTTVLIRTTRQAMHNVLDTSYVKAAKAKGLSNYQVLTRHALRNGLLPVIQMLGTHFGTLITLAMVTEVIFSWPGLGSWLVDAIHQRDYPAIQGGLMVMSGMVFIATILFDILYMAFDPLARRRGYGKI